MNTRHGITQPPVAPCAGSLIQTKNKTKIQTQSSADRITTSLNPALLRGGKKEKPSAQILPYMKFTQTTGLTAGGQTPKERKTPTLKPRKRIPQVSYTVS